MTNFLVGIVVARSLGPQEFGAFGLAFATYVVALNASGALASQPLMVRYSATPEPEWRRATAAACGVALAVGVALGAACVLVALLTSGPISQAYLALGIALPGLLLQDTWRMAFFAMGRGRDALINDLVWAVALVAAFAATIVTGRASLFVLTLVWGIAANIAALAGIAQAHVVPAVTRVRPWLIEHRDLGPRFLAESLVLSGTQQLVVAGVAGVAGLTAVAGIRAAQILLGPPYVFTMGFKLVMLPQAVAARRSSLTSVRRMCATLSMSMSAIMLAWGAAIALLPYQWGVWLLGETWGPARAVLIPVTLAYAAGAAILGASTGLRALAAAKRSLSSRVVASGLQVSGGIAGAALGGGPGAAWGLALAGGLSVVVFWRFLLGAFAGPTPPDAAEIAEPVQVRS